MWLHGEVRTPPLSAAARLEAGVLLRRLQRGDGRVGGRGDGRTGDPGDPGDPGGRGGRGGRGDPGGRGERGDPGAG